jgi:hypothetical protein
MPKVIPISEKKLKKAAKKKICPGRSSETAFHWLLAL